jgi:beta-glucosidase
MKKSDSKKNGAPSVSLKDKLSLLSGDGDWRTHSLSKAKIEAVEMHDGPLGLRKPANSLTSGNDPSASSMPATCFPAPCLTACSWDPKLLSEMGKCMAAEAIDQETDVVLAPGVNIKRNPLCGRNFEYLSEDPYLAGKMAAGFIRGVQAEGVGASLKHFACNNQENRRFTYSAEVDERTLREIYLKPFEIAVKEARPWTVMCSYNRINGVYASENKWLLHDILRNEWGYDGCVISDWGAVLDPSVSDSAGLDLEMPCHSDRVPYLRRAMRRGLLPSDKVDAEARHVIALSQKAASKPEPKQKYDYSISAKICEKVILKSLILAKNHGRILPLSSYEDCCVIGGFAKTPRYQGSGSSRVNANHLMSFYDAANAAGPNGKPLPYAQGYPMKKGESADALCVDAVDLASQHKTVLLFLGIPDEWEAEGYDRVSMRLPKAQYDLFDAIYSQNTRIIVVLMTGSPVELPFYGKAEAFLVAYLTGQEGGSAIDEILRGKANPCGKLAETWPLRYSDVPSANFYQSQSDISLYKESLFVGYRYYLTAHRDVLYPFGHGLSYASYRYSNLHINRSEIGIDEVLKGSFSIKNTGKTKGEEIYQIYIRPLTPQIMKPFRELRSFGKVKLFAGRTKRQMFSLPYSAFSHFDPDKKSWEVEAGDYLIEIGSSSLNIKLQAKVHVDSSYAPIDQKAIYPSYFSFKREGSFAVTEEEFISMLGHLPSDDILRTGKCFNMNSPVGDLAKTFIGKKLISPEIEKAYNPDLPDEVNASRKAMMLQSPIRMAAVTDIGEKKAMAIVALSNKRLLSALLVFLFGWPRQKAK